MLRGDVRHDARKSERETWRKGVKCKRMHQVVNLILFNFHFRIRQNRVRMQQEAQRDAPDPRESRPPCYADALLMPRLDGSFASLDELGSGRIKRRRRKTEEAQDIEEEVMLRRTTRSRSEEVLSMREVVARNTRTPRVDPRIHPVEIEPIDPNRSSNEDEPEGIHYCSTDIMTLDHSPGPSSRARSPQMSVRLVVSSIQPKGASSEEIKNFNQSNNELEGSPYANRKLNHMESFKGDRNKKALTAPPPIPPLPIEITEDHFKNVVKQRRDSTTDSEDSSEFITIKPGKQQSSNSSSNEDGMVIVSRPTSF